MYVLQLLLCFANVPFIIARPTPEDSTTKASAPWLNSGKFQGDIDGYTQESFDKLISDLNKWQEHRQQHRNRSTTEFESAISDPRGLWVNGRVPYVISSSDPKLIEAVHNAMDAYHRSTCIRFVERTNEENYLDIHDIEDGCHAVLGNAHIGPQGVNLGPGCKYTGIAIHELMHAIGFWHEQQRTDRDDHVIVTLENVIPKYKDQYYVAKTSQMNLIGNYDLSSVMHYSADAFALPGLTVMKAKHSEQTQFGGEKLTDEDQRKIRQLYRCDGGGNNGDTKIESGAIYFIKPENTDNCLDVPGSSAENGMLLQQWDCNRTPAQQWVLTQLNGNIYSIKNVGNGKYVDVAAEEENQDGGKVQQHEKHDGVQQQQFKFEARAGGLFHITSVVNGKIIWTDMKGKVRHWKYDAGQNWKLERFSPAAYIHTGLPYFIKEPGTNKCLDVSGSRTENGLQIQEWDCNQTPAQQWIFTELSPNVYSIKNVASGKYLDVASEEQDKEGGKVQQYESHDGGPFAVPQQKFRLDPKGSNIFHLTSVANGRIIWTNTDGKLCHWKYDAGQNWMLEH